MRNSEDPPYFERTGCSRDCECRSYTSQLNTVSEESSQSRMTSEEILRRLARRTVREDVIFGDKLGSLTVGLRHERSVEQILKNLRFWCFEETIILTMLNPESESCFYVLTSKIGITESSDKLFFADTRVTRITVGFRRQCTCPSI